MNQQNSMVVTDFDGTIYSKANHFHPQDLETLKELGREEVPRVIATGRSMESLYRAVDTSFPVDFIVFSSGAGVFELKTRKLLKRTVFSSVETLDLCRRLSAMKVDFMVHHPIPDNHYFHYYHTGGGNPDFFHRLSIYKNYAFPFDWDQLGKLEATQFVIITPPGSGAYHRLEAEFRDVSMIWSTSPLDHSSRWVELFPEGAHKGTGVAWLSDRLGIPAESVMVVGNDFNDIHMLQWSSHPFVVANAPEELKQQFQVVAGCEEAGFSMAVGIWKKRLESSGIL